MVNSPIEVKIGQKIREWTVIEFDPSRKKGRHFICECKCGRRLSKPIADLIRGGPDQCKSCATKARNFGKYGHPLKDLIGQKFGRWLVLERAFSKSRTGGFWKCRCDCGHTQDVFGGDLRRGKSTKCQKCAHFKHGALCRKERKSEYNTWYNMRMRCTNPKEIGFKRYGERGISVCKRWLNSFVDFYSDVGPKPTPKHSLDRIDNDGNYEPGNVRWATATEQARNRPKKSCNDNISTIA